MSVESVDRTLLDDVCSRLRKQLSDDDAARAEAFVRQYYRWVAPEDLAERNPLDLFTVATRPLLLDGHLAAGRLAVAAGVAAAILALLARLAARQLHNLVTAD